MKEVAVFTTWDEPIADMAAGLLVAEGITVRMRTGGNPRIFPMTMDGLATISLMVAEDEADRARELIAVRFAEYDGPPCDEGVDGEPEAS